jgi:hypothetical protein
MKALSMIKLSFGALTLSFVFTFSDQANAGYGEEFSNDAVCEEIQEYGLPSDISDADLDEVDEFCGGYVEEEEAATEKSFRARQRPGRAKFRGNSKVTCTEGGTCTFN